MQIGRPSKHRRVLLFVLASICGTLFNLWVLSLNPSLHSIDFAQFYAAGRIAGTGRLYDWDTLRQIEHEYNAHAVPTARLPVVAYAYKLLSNWSYNTARLFWLALSGTAGIAAVILWPQGNRGLMLSTLAWSLPAGFILFFGQDLLLWLFCFALGLYLIEKSRPALAGIAFALCIIKYHLLIGLAVMLFAQRRWRTILAGSSLALFFFLASFWVEGRDWFATYLNLLTSSKLSPGPQGMPTLYGIASWFSQPTIVEVVSACMIVFFLWSASKRAPVGIAGGLAAAAGLLLGHHAYGQDCIVLLPIAALVLQETKFEPLIRVLGVVILSPLPLLLLTSNHPYWGQGVILLFVVGSLIFISKRCQGEMASGKTPFVPAS